MSLNIVVQPDFGWVILSTTFSFFVNIFLGIKVGQARKKYNVPYPHMYDANKPEFNCVQRGHQNMLETHYAVWLMTLISGLVFPKASALLNLIWTFGRIVYFFQYSSGKPEKRIASAPFIYLPLFILMGLSVYIGFQMLGTF